MSMVAGFDTQEGHDKEIGVENTEAETLKLAINDYINERLHAIS